VIGFEKMQVRTHYRNTKVKCVGEEGNLKECIVGKLTGKLSGYVHGSRHTTPQYSERPTVTIPLVSKRFDWCNSSDGLVLQQ